MSQSRERRRETSRATRDRLSRDPRNIDRLDIYGLLLMLALSAGLYLVIGPVGVPSLPFVWHSSALVSLATAAWLAWQIAGSLGNVTSRRRIVVLAGIGWAIAIGLTVVSRMQSDRVWDLPLMAVSRVAIAVCGMCGVMLTVRVLRPAVFGVGAVADRNHLRFATIGLGFLLVTLPAVTQFQALVHARQTELQELLGQSRLSEARRLARELELADPDRQLSGQSIKVLSRQLTEHLQTLSRQARHLSADRSIDGRIERGRILAILGEHDAAIESLTAAIERQPRSARAWQILGAVHEHREEWVDALQAYQTASELWPESPSPEDAQSGQIAAWKGIAFAQRKQGQLREADAAYQQLIAIAPTAPNHFLLARFYESAERSATAIEHARQAATLDPTNYDAPAADLIRKVSQGGFGCLAGLKHRTRPDDSHVNVSVLSRPRIAGGKP